MNRKICYNTRRHLRRGQAMVEYVLVLAGIVLLAAVLWQFVETSQKHAVRTQRLMSTEYP